MTKFKILEMCKNLLTPLKKKNNKDSNRVILESQESFKTTYLSKESQEVVTLSEDISIEDQTNSLNSLNSFDHKSIIETKNSNENSIKAVKLYPLDRIAYKNNKWKTNCYYGLAGEIIKEFEPHTEADSKALLLNLLILFGSLIGRNTYFEADGAKHYTNLFGVLVGGTSAGKGTSFSQIKRLFELVDKNWSKDRIQSGLSSGEGLIHAVRDESHDKRLLLVESEFASVLSMNKREGNILSPVIRGLWDDGSASILTKNNPISTNDAHISIIGHITPDELAASLSKPEISNGFANRFLWLKIKRSKLLPDGGNVSDEILVKLAAKLNDAVIFSKDLEKIDRDESAQRVWTENYDYLTKEKLGAFGNVTTRARPQVARLSVIYALLDKSSIIREEHLEAALDLWLICENSAREIFGEKTGDKFLDNIYELLKDNPEGISRTDIHKSTNCNSNSHDVLRAMNRLVEFDMAVKVKKQVGSKSIDIWVIKENYEINELTSNSKQNMGLKV